MDCLPLLVRRLQYLHKLRDNKGELDTKKGVLLMRSALPAPVVSRQASGGDGRLQELSREPHIVERGK
jgi:hypothetical protein